MNELYIIGEREVPVGRQEIRSRRFADPDAALAAVAQSSSEGVLVCDARLVRRVRLDRVSASGCDLLHAGLLLGRGGSFQTPMMASVTWFFLDPEADRRCTSWKATTDLCWMRPETVRAVGGFDAAYSSADSRLMDLAYRILVAGGRVCHDPQLLEMAPPLEGTAELPWEDELLFVCRHLGRSLAVYAAAWAGLRQRRPSAVPRALGSALARSRREAPPRPAPLELVGPHRRQHVGSISAIIPTLNRYDYLPQAIDSLLRQDPRPDEIIVVDQTPAERRKPELYAPYKSSDVRVIYLQRAGQSLARNTAVEAATGEWCLFFDDDSVAWDDMLARHIEAVEYSGADGSTGVSLAPWKTVSHIPPHARLFHVANVLDTGNSLLKRSAVLAVGGLNLAFDRGSGADNELGTRLYLKGYEVLFNPAAIRTHYKAAVGGLRTHGAWWRNRTTFWGPHPAPTEIFTLQQYYPRSVWPAHYLNAYLRASHHHNRWETAWLWLCGPWKLARALRAAGHLQTTLGLAPHGGCRSAGGPGERSPAETAQAQAGVRFR